ncbi:MAG: amidase [Desulfosalsimonadaceae bacterium]
MKRLFDSSASTFFTCLVFCTGILLATGITGCQSVPPPKPYQAPTDAVARSGRPYVFYSATEMAEAIQKEEITSLELVKAHLAHIHLHNPALNAIVTLDEDAILKRAAEADRALARGIVWGPLHGVPVTVKDHFAVRNMRTTNAHPEMAEQITLFDATVVERLKAAGAIILGKTNLPFAGMDLQTHNAIFGRTNNPWDLDRTPGGSTGGGGAAVAAGLTPIDIGSDLGGSLRLPAHFTGTYSIKPTENTVSAYGSFPGLLDPDERSVRHMASFGPIARSLDDLKRIFQIISGPDGKDALVMPLAPYPSENRKTINSLRIAWSNNFGGIPVSEEIRDEMALFVKALSDAGATVVREDPDINFEEAWKTWGEMINLQIMYNQPGHIRFFTFLFGWSYRAQTPLLQMVYPLSIEKYLQVLNRRDHFVTGFERFISDWDVFICPVATVPAIEHYPPDAIRSHMPIYTRPITVDGHKLNYYTALLAYAVPFNLTGHPVVTIPAGFTPDGLPIGVQIVGKRWEDLQLLDIAEIIDEVIGAYRPPDGY